jgi:hypothetical protein
MGLWQVLEHGGFNGVLAENVEAAIGRGLAWTVGFVIVSVVILGIVRRRAAHRLPVCVVVLGTVLVMSWALPGSTGLTHDEPRYDFHTLRPALDDVVEHAVRGDLDGPYAELPRGLDFVSVTGSVDVHHEAEGPGAVTIFVPQWARLVDDAGGYIYSAHRRPDVDMHGMACTAPTRLDGGWWSC